MGQASEIARRGHDLTVWTTSFFHYDKRQRKVRDSDVQTEEGYRVRILRSWSYGRNISARRLLAHSHFSKRLRRALESVGPPDLIVAYLPPLDTVAVVADYAKRTGVPLVIDVIDPWPDVFVRLPPVPLQPVARALLSPLYRQAARALGQADGIASISAEYVAWARKLGAADDIQGKVFYPAVDIAQFDQDRGKTRRNHRPEQLTAIYAGSLGHSYDVETIIDCATLFDQEAGPASVRFVIAGAGPALHRLKKQAVELTNVNFTGWLDAPQLAQQLAQAHVGLACYRADATQSVTYKLFDYLAAGLPIVCSLPGEMSEILLTNDIGLQCRAEDAGDLFSTLQQLLDHNRRIQMSERARSFAEAHGDTRRVSALYADFLEEVIGGAV